MPQFAADALESGFDGPALRRLAGMLKPTLRDVGELFEKSLTEIGTVTIHNAEQGALLLARTTARDIVEEQVDPIKGAIFLAGLASAMHYPGYLYRFYELMEMPYWGEPAPHTSELIRNIIEEARLLLAQTPG